MRATWKEILPHEVADKLKKGEQLTIVDVRERDEWLSGHIPGARHIPLWQIPLRLSDLNALEDTILVCGSGGRSSRACEYLTKMGYKAVNMKGGMAQWSGDRV
jgi:rhodanese-related sulfurtransferase